MDFFKFVSLLSQEALFFSRVRMFEDPFEGAFPQNGFDPEIRRRFESINHRDIVAVNCWHMNEYESAAMWKLYGDNIAIQSTFQRLAASFDCAPTTINIGMVEYIDYNSNRAHATHADNMLTYLLHKRPDFGYENELRALTLITPSASSKRAFDPESEETDEEALNASDPDPGMLVGVDLNVLIEKIYVSPTLTTLKPWVMEVVKSIVRKFALDKPIERSTLFDPPARIALDPYRQR